MQIWAAEKLQKTQDTGLNSRLKIKVHDSAVRNRLNGCGLFERVRELRELCMTKLLHSDVTDDGVTQKHHCNSEGGATRC